MIDKIKEIAEKIDQFTAKNADELEALRIQYLSKKGEVSALFNDFRNVAADQKKEMGQLLNDLKNKAQDKINELKEQFDGPSGESNDIDLTRTSYPIPLGTRHPLSLVKEEIIDILPVRDLL